MGINLAYNQNDCEMFKNNETKFSKGKILVQEVYLLTDNRWSQYECEKCQFTLWD